MMAKDQANAQSPAGAFEALLEDVDTGAGEGHEEETDELEGAPEGDDESEGEGEEGEEEPRYTVKVDGEEIEVPLSELRNGYQRHTDYTRKTQKLAETRRQLAERETAADEVMAKYSETLQALEAQVAPKEPDWARLRAEDPVAFAEVWERFQAQKKVHEAVLAEQERVAEHAQLERQERLKRRVAEERDLLTAAIPEWVDPDVARKERSALVEFGKSIGFSETELDRVVDHRAVVLLRKAWLYDQVRSRTPQAARKIQEVRSAPPGSRRKADANSVTRAKERLKQTGRLEDAASVFAKMI